MNRTWLAVASIAIFGGSSSETVANECEARTMDLSVPEYRVTTDMVTTLARQGGSCAVLVRYVLDSAGEPSEIAASVEEKQCEVFQHVAIEALESSVFRPGRAQANCEHTFNFELTVNPGGPVRLKPNKSLKADAINGAA